ncbi:hypothetical protein LNP74_23610 [Klebsiella pneumoniae subsp. pneumoniae]|nr:hypothetical protein [Klebsiella pneumoniae subsp. pneumoniae]
MEHFLALTLAGRLPHHFHGETAYFRWHWQGGGILELTPHARCEARAGTFLRHSAATKRRRWR